MLFAVFLRKSHIWENFCSLDREMFSANQIAGYFNQQCLQNKSSKLPDFLHVDGNSHKLKVDPNIIGWV